MTKFRSVFLPLALIAMLSLYGCISSIECPGFDRSNPLMELVISPKEPMELKFKREDGTLVSFTRDLYVSEAYEQECQAFSGGCECFTEYVMSYEHGSGASAIKLRSDIVVTQPDEDDELALITIRIAGTRLNMEFQNGNPPWATVVDGNETLENVLIFRDIDGNQQAWFQRGKGLIRFWHEGELFKLEA